MSSSASPAQQPAPQAISSWADKYKPQSIEQMCYPVSANKIRDWIHSFDPSNPKHPNGALLSGPPGIGKTTTVFLVAKAMGYQVIEYNASDFRSKKSLHENVSSVVRNSVFSTSGAERVHQQHVRENRFLLLMDEVDGCDIGGVGEVIQMIKDTKIPILCTCNDRWHPKLRSLLNHVEDVRFSRPPCNIVANYICDRVLAKEGVSLSKQLLQDIIKNSGSDLRSILNNLQLWSKQHRVLDQNTLASCAAQSYKNGDVGLFEAAETFLLQGSSSSSGPKSVLELQSAYYNSELVDLFVQENYLHFKPPQKDWMRSVAHAAQCISQSDALQRIMYHEQNWSVSNGYVLLSSIAPCAAVRGHYESFASGQQVFFDRQRPVKFPTWLGNNSTAGKNQRLLSVLTTQASHPTEGLSGNRQDVVLDYTPLAFADRVVRPLQQKEKEGIADVTQFMDSYHMERDDWDFVQEVVGYKRMRRPPTPRAQASSIPTAVKSAFTREFNKTHKTESLAKGIFSGKGGGNSAGSSGVGGVGDGEGGGGTGGGSTQGAEDDDEQVAEEEAEELLAMRRKAEAAAAAPKGPAKRKTKAAPDAKSVAKAPAPSRAKKAPVKRPLTFIAEEVED